MLKFKIKKNQPQFLYPKKISFKYGREIKKYSDKPTLREF